MELQGNHELFFPVAISTNAALEPHINHCGLKHVKVKYRYLLLLVPPPSPLGTVKAFNTFTNFGENSNLETSSEVSSAFSFIFTPLTYQLKNGPKYLAWNTAADKAFKKLNTTFTTAPFLKHPDPPKPSIVVGASETG